MTAQQFKENLLYDFSEILTASKLKYLENSIDTIINQVKLDVINQRYKKPIEIDSHGANDYIRKANTNEPK
jgi:hypothetical protein